MKDVSLLAEFMITAGFFTCIHVFSTINNLEFTWNFNIVLKKSQMLRMLRYICKIGNLTE